MLQLPLLFGPFKMGFPLISYLKGQPILKLHNPANKLLFGTAHYYNYVSPFFNWPAPSKNTEVSLQANQILIMGNLS